MAQTDKSLLRAYLDEGLRAHSEARIEAAREAYARALAIDPAHPDALNLMGTAWLQLGDASEAARYLERAAQKLRNHPGVVGNLAHAYFELGRYEEARETYRKASRLEPNNVYFQMGVANCLGMRGRLAEAERRLRRVADRFPGVALVWYNLGNALREQKKLQDALPCYLKALDLDPHLMDARNNLGSVLHALYRFDEAEREYRACIAIDPDYVPSQYNLASVLIDIGRFQEAEGICREIIERAPSVPSAHAFLGAALSHQGRLLEATECSRAAAALAPQDATVVGNYAAALAETGNVNRAFRQFSRALALAPDSRSTHQMLGTVLLAQGCLADGWIEYGCRPASISFREKYSNVVLSRTLPSDLAGEQVVLTREQGLGDEIFLLRFAPWLTAAGARVIYRASEKIRTLVSRAACLEQVVSENAPAPHTGTMMLLGDLPHALSSYPATPLSVRAPDNDEFSRFDVPFRISVFWPPVALSLAIRPLETRIVEMRQRLAQAGNPPYLGVSWKGGTPPREQRAGPAWSLYKEIGINVLAKAVGDIRGTFLALQRNPEPDEIEHFSRTLGRPFHDFSALNEDLEGMLALLALIDEYIGVSNTNTHLRAAAGKTARVLVPCPAEWRWMAAGSSSPWFPGFSIYRQSLDGDWSAALARLRQDLNNLYR